MSSRCLEGTLRVFPRPLYALLIPALSLIPFVNTSAQTKATPAPSAATNPAVQASTPQAAMTPAPEKVDLENLVLLPDSEKEFSPASNLVQRTPTAGAHAPELNCPTLDFRSWKTWQDAGRAMSKMPSCYLYQNWVENADKSLKPSTVSVAHVNNCLIVYAELMDDDIYNVVQQDNTEADRSGDIFEIFLRPENEKTTFEHHITPDNFAWQLRWPDATTAKAMSAEEQPEKQAFAGDSKIVHSKVLVQQTQKMWRILAIIPLDKLMTNPKAPIPAVWRFAFCRADANHGQDITTALSSTSAQTSPDFQEQETWGKLTLDK